MTPFKLALWIAKFVASLVLLLVIVPGAVYYGGLFATSEVVHWRNLRSLRATEREAATSCATLGKKWQSNMSATGDYPNDDLGICVDKKFDPDKPFTATAAPEAQQAALPSCAEYFKRHDTLPANFDFEAGTIGGVQVCHI